MKAQNESSFVSISLRTLRAIVVLVTGLNLIQLTTAKPKDTIVTTVSVQPWPSGIVVSPDDKSVYVGSILGPVSVIATDTNTVSATISTGGNLAYVAIAPDGSDLFATQYGPGPSTGESVLYDVNLSTQNTTSVDISQNEQLLAINPSGTLLCVTSSYINLPGTVQILNPIGLQLLNVINVGGIPRELVFTPDGAHAYVCNFAGAAGPNGYLSYVSLSSASVRAITNAAFNNPLYLAISPDASELYVVQLDSFNSKGVEKKGVLFFDTKNREVDHEIAVFNPGADKANSSTYLGEPALTLDGKFLYVPVYASIYSPPGAPVTEAQGNTVAVISTANGKVVDTITVGESPWQVAIGDDQRAYVSNYGDGTVTVIDITE
jgi:YVTN family beta-propeller protein